MAFLCAKTVFRNVPSRSFGPSILKLFKLMIRPCMLNEWMEFNLHFIFTLIGVLLGLWVNGRSIDIDLRVQPDRVELILTRTGF